MFVHFADADFSVVFALSPARRVCSLLCSDREDQRYRARLRANQRNGRFQVVFRIGVARCIRGRWFHYTRSRL